MIIAFKLTLIIVILVSLGYAFGSDDREASKLLASLLCVFGIVAFIVSSLVL